MQKQEFLKSHAGSPANTSLDLSALTAARVYSGRPLKLLCLHGGDMSGDGFQVMTMAMAEELKPLVQLSFPTAPYSEQPPGTDYRVLLRIIEVVVVALTPKQKVRVRLELPLSDRRAREVGAPLLVEWIVGGAAALPLLRVVALLRVALRILNAPAAGVGVGGAWHVAKPGH